MDFLPWLGMLGAEYYANITQSITPISFFVCERENKYCEYTHNILKRNIVSFTQMCAELYPNMRPALSPIVPTNPKLGAKWKVLFLSASNIIS